MVFTKFDNAVSIKGVKLDFKLIEKCAGGCLMPLCYGERVSRTDQAAKVDTEEIKA